jgi:hypothetical protein
LPPPPLLHTKAPKTRVERAARDSATMAGDGGPRCKPEKSEGHRILPSRKHVKPAATLPAGPRSSVDRAAVSCAEAGGKPGVPARVTCHV